MSRLGFKSLVYHGDVCLGELDTIPVLDTNFQFPNNEIRIHHISPTSERCIPLSILHTISSFTVRCKLESSSPVEQPHLIHLHASCFYEFKTAVVLVGDEEVHLVAMPSKQKKLPCFWCFSVPTGLYNSCLGMLNLRCLAIVFDLDETLIVANTMKSFEDRIEALRGWIARETDSIRLSGMSAELRRYMDDRLLLKQFTESDCVVDNGKVFKIQMEEVPPLSDGHEKVVRPVIRLQERNIVLTRINPEVRDTSVLVRLRPVWEELRSYLTAKGRKRFEVYVCTMAERDYALEMWRLLDPEAHLIDSKQLLDRVVCVKFGSRKSLLNVFRDGKCHPQMAMVIDDRSKVWEDKDQPRVHVVPPFAPYYAPQAEVANAVPVLKIARNVACNARGLFFKEFDENVLRKISEVFYEDEVVNLPLAPDVSSYLMSEEAGFAPNGNNGAFISEGMNGVEVERRMNQSEEKHVLDSSTHTVTNNPELRSETSQPPVTNVVGPASSIAPLPFQKPSLLGAPGLLSNPMLLGASVRRGNNSSDSDYDMKRRVLGTKQSLDLRNQSSVQPPLLPKLPVQTSSSSVLPQGGWLVEEDINEAHLNDRSSGSAQESDKLRGYQNPFSHTALGSISTGLPSHASQVKVEEASIGLDTPKRNVLPIAHVSACHDEVLVSKYLSASRFLMEPTERQICSSSVSVMCESPVDVQEWARNVQLKEGDCLVEGYFSSLPERVNLKLTQNNLTELADIWDRMNGERKRTFSEKYGQIASLISVIIEESMIRAAIQFWDPSYRCFAFNKEDLTPTIEEYSVLIGLELRFPDKVYVRKQKLNFRKRLNKLIGMEIRDLDLKQKGEHICIPWYFFRKFIEGHLDDEKGMTAFAMAIYGMVIFPTVLGHIEVAVIDFVEQVENHCNPSPAILAETIRSLNFCRRKGKGRFVGCAPLLHIWLKSHFVCEDSAFSKPYLRSRALITEFCESKCLEPKSKGEWIAFLRSLTSKQIRWMAPWMPYGSMLYRCGEPWVQLLGPWGAVSYAPLMVLRQYGVKQFVPVTHRLNQLEFSYRDPNMSKKAKPIARAWKKTQRMRLGSLSDGVTPRYLVWRANRVNNVVLPVEEVAFQPTPVPPKRISELEIVEQDFDIERKKMRQESQRF